MTARPMSRKFTALFLPGALALVALLGYGHGIRRPVTLTVAGPLPRPGQFPHRLLDGVLAAAVDDSGRVMYRALNADPAELETYLTHLARVSPARQPELFPTRGDSMAYWINAYNAFALTLARDHYPRPPRRLDDPLGWTPGAAFALRRFEAGGRWLSLSDIENGCLRARFRDPRLHLVLNCASRGCPPLARAALHPERCDEELDAAVRRSLASPWIFQADTAARVVRLSALFRWYWADFRRDLPRDTALNLKVGNRALLTWLDPYLPADLSRRLRDGSAWRVEFLPWDWSLNEAPPPVRPGTP